MQKIYKLEPLFKNYLWGGTKLLEEFGYKSDYDKVSEAWVLSGHKTDSNIVSQTSETLRSLVEKHKLDILGSKSPLDDEMPLLIKFIDAKEHLSVQVHPNDEQAQLINEPFGKSEMWYIVDTEENNHIVFGPKTSLTTEHFKEYIEAGTLEDHMHYAPITPGDSIYIEAGTIHAIQAGTTVLEVQQSSDTTYRIYDYNRKDSDGNLRDLHIEESIKVSNLEPSVGNFKRKSESIDNNEVTKLEHCEYFNVDNIEVSEKLTIETNTDSFISLIILDGEGSINCESETLKIKKGDSILLPAQDNIYTLTGHLTMIKVSL